MARTRKPRHYAETAEGRARIEARRKHTPHRAAWPSDPVIRETAESPYRHIRLAVETAWRAEMIEENRADVGAIIEAMRVARETPVNHSGHIDHTPGGSPERYIDPAPAPRHEWRPRAPHSFRPKTRRAAPAPDARVPMAELMSRAYAASRQALQGKQWSEDDRQDATSYVLEKVIEREAKTGPVGATVARENATGLVLYRLATDARIQAERETGRIDELTHRAFTSQVVSDDGPGQLRRAAETVASPRKARLAAVHMLAELECTTAWGPTFTVAYTAARAPWHGKEGFAESSRDVAAELDMSFTAYRKHMSRGRKLIAETAPTAEHMAERLLLMDPAAGSGGYLSACKLIADWRGLDKSAPAPAAPKLTVSRKRTGAPRRTPAAWTRDLPERTRHRLHALASARQERSGLAAEHRTRATV